MPTNATKIRIKRYHVATQTYFWEEYVTTGAIDTESEPGKKKFYGGEWGQPQSEWGAWTVNVTSTETVYFVAQVHLPVTIE